jgi:uncharacterized protein (DUF1697 family)
MEELTINYNEQMLDYYPEVIKAIREFQVLMATESIQVDEVHKKLTQLLEDAYVSTASAERIEMWENLLGIVPLPQGDDSMETWLEDRRETILARLYQTPKLNTKSIADIVSIFTGGTAISYFDNNTSTIVVKISPPKNNKSYKFANVEQELRKKVPAHLLFQVSRNYSTWAQIVAKCPTWEDIKNQFTTWEDVLLYNELWELSMR